MSDGGAKTAGGSLPVWPTPIRRLNQGVRPGHIAWDIDANLGDPVRAMVAGIVERLIENEPSGYGNLVIIRDAQGNRFYYGHNSAFAVQPGDRVLPGQLIALAGSTGRSSGSHVHLEIRDPGGRQVDPGAFFSGQSFREITAPLRAAAAAIASKAAPATTSAPNYEVVRPIQSAAAAAQVRRQPIHPLVAEAVNLLQRAAGVQPSEEETQEREGTKILSTPIGDVTLAPLPWANLGAIAGGAVLALIGTMVLARPAVQREIEKAGGITGIATKAAVLAI